MSRKETEEERRIRKEKEKATGGGKRQETEEERRIRKEKEKAAEAPRRGSGSERQETEEERRIRKEKEKAPAGGQGRQETEEERRIRKEKEKAAGGSRQETEEERRIRKEKEKADKERAAAGGARQETEEERRIRKEKEKAAAPQETEEERRIRKDRHEKERAAAGGARQETEEERRIRKDKEKQAAAPPPPPPPAEPAYDKIRTKGVVVGTASPTSQLKTTKAGPVAKPKAPAADEEEENYDDDFEEDTGPVGDKAQLASLKQAMERENAAAGTYRSPGAVAAPAEVVVSNIQRRGLTFDDVRKEKLREKKEKELQRANNLKRVVDLDFATITVADFPPLTEYDMLMRGGGMGGVANKVQSSVQAPPDTDLTAAESQTDKVQYKSRECQAPDDGSCPTDSDRVVKSGVTINFQGLRSFMQRIFPVMRTLLDENAQRFAPRRRTKTSELKFSSTYSTLAHEEVVGRKVLQVLFCKTTPHHFLTLHGPSTSTKGKLVAFAGIFFLWNTNDWSAPDAILLSCSALTTACFGSSKPYLIFAGTREGTLNVWDLRETDAMHCAQPKIGNIFARQPTYTTNWLLAENHTSAVCSVLVVGYNSTIGAPTRGDDVTEQIASLDEFGTVIFWIIVDSDRKDAQVSETDFGLNMFSKVKLFKSSPLVLGCSTFALDFQPEDPGLFLVATDAGTILHLSRFKISAVPSVYRCNEISTFLDEHTCAISMGAQFGMKQGIAVSTIQYCPTDSRLFLAGMSDGTISLFRNDASTPRLSWTDFSSNRIALVRWSNVTKGVFYVLDSQGLFGLFDLLQDDAERRLEPLVKCVLGTPGALCLTMTLSYELEGTAQIALGYADGRVEMHELNDRILNACGSRGGKYLLQI